MPATSILSQLRKALIDFFLHILFTEALVYTVS